MANFTAKLTTDPDVNAELEVLFVVVEALLATGLLLVAADEATGFATAEEAGVATEAVLTGLAAVVLDATLLGAALELACEATDGAGALDTALLGVALELACEVVDVVEALDTALLGAALELACETELELCEATLGTAEDGATLLLAELTAVVLLAEVEACELPCVDTSLFVETVSLAAELVELEATVAEVLVAAVSALLELATEADDGVLSTEFSAEVLVDDVAALY